MHAFVLIWILNEWMDGIVGDYSNVSGIQRSIGMRASSFKYSKRESFWETVVIAGMLGNFQFWKDSWRARGGFIRGRSSSTNHYTGCAHNTGPLRAHATWSGLIEGLPNEWIIIPRAFHEPLQQFNTIKYFAQSFSSPASQPANEHMWKFKSKQEEWEIKSKSLPNATHNINSFTNYWTQISIY